MQQNTMRAAVLECFDTPLVIKELPMPRINSNEVLVKVMASGLCGSDLHIQEGRINSVKLPFTPGHETAGIVMECGNAVLGFEKGDHVVVAIDIICKTCRFCREGRENLCENLVRLGFECDGGHGQYMVCPADNLFKISKSVPFEQAAVIPDAVACMYHAIKNQANVGMGDKICILGIGGLGIQGVQIAKNLGAQVFCTSRQDEKLLIAKKYGADYTINTKKQDLKDEITRITNGEMCDVVFDNIGIENSIQLGLDLVRPGGKVIIVGYIDTTFTAAYMDTMMKEKEIIGMRGSRPSDLIEVISLVERGMLTPYIYKTYKLNEINEAINDLRIGSSLGRTVIMPQED